MLEHALTMEETDLDQLSSLFRLLSEKTRLAILLQLARGERNVTSLCEELSLPQPTVSHHLGLLRMNNIVANRRSGKQVYYGLMAQARRPDSVLEFLLHSVIVSVAPRGPDGDVV